jgi:hypothetical protein
MDSILYNEFIKVFEGTDFEIETYTDKVSIRRVKGEYKAVYFACSKSDFTIDGVIKFVESELKDSIIQQRIYKNYSSESADDIIRSAIEVTNFINKAIRRVKVSKILKSDNIN